MANGSSKVEVAVDPSDALKVPKVRNVLQQDVVAWWIPTSYLHIFIPL